MPLTIGAAHIARRATGNSVIVPTSDRVLTLSAGGPRCPFRRARSCTAIPWISTFRRWRTFAIDLYLAWRHQYASPLTMAQWRVADQLRLGDR